MVCVWEGCHRLAARKHPGSHPARWAHESVQIWGPEVTKVTLATFGLGGHRIQTCADAWCAPCGPGPPAMCSGMGTLFCVQPTRCKDARSLHAG